MIRMFWASFGKWGLVFYRCRKRILIIRRRKKMFKNNSKNNKIIISIFKKKKKKKVSCSRRFRISSSSFRRRRISMRWSRRLRIWLILQVIIISIIIRNRNCSSISIIGRGISKKFRVWRIIRSSRGWIYLGEKVRISKQNILLFYIIYYFFLYKVRIIRKGVRRWICWKWGSVLCFRIRRNRIRICRNWIRIRKGGLRSWFSVFRKVLLVLKSIGKSLYLSSSLMFSRSNKFSNKYNSSSSLSSCLKEFKIKIMVIFRIRKIIIKIIMLGLACWDRCFRRINRRNRLSCLISGILRVMRRKINNKNNKNKI